MAFQGERILVTGADGFIGSHLTEALLAGGASVRALAQYNSFNSWGWLEALPPHANLQIITGDIRDPHFCLEAMQDVDRVFHLAALIAIPFSYRAPDSYLETNIRGTLNICQAARAKGVKCLVHTSTSEVYGTARYVPIDEAHPLTPQSPYSASKIAADALAASFYYSFGLPVVIARPFNTYGPRQSARAIIPTIIAQIASGRKTIALGDLTPTRDFNFVEDTCRGLMAVASLQEGFGQVFNVGANQEISVGDLFRLIAGQMGSDAQVEQEPDRFRAAQSEVRRLRCNNEKLVKASGWQPRVTLREGLRRTIEWFQTPENLKRYKPDIYNV